MKAILVLMDTLRYDVLSLCEGLAELPNFKRLAGNSVQYIRHYAGSLPCMPARRELHTGRYNFMHRGWGPIEPYDDSMPEILKNAGVYTHLVSDHYHYWDDGGATYHPRYSSWENVRGHESDPWKGDLGSVEVPEFENVWRPEILRRNYINRKYMPDYCSSSLVRTFDLGMEFVDRNHDQDSWLLQIESFTPHEPFVSYPEFREKLPKSEQGINTEWGVMASRGNPEFEEDTRNDYRALLLECDDQLGRLLDRMDQHDLWRDTMLILTADHGTLLGEHGEWNKNRQPLFEEIVRTPFFVWDPREGRRGIQDTSLNRMIDLPATLLDYFGVERPENMLGRPINEGGCNGALFGYFGSYVCCTDGRYVYMRAAANSENRPLNTYFLMPTELFQRFGVKQMTNISLVSGCPATKNVPVLKMQAPLGMFPDFMYHYGTLLYDLAEDPQEIHPLKDRQIEEKMEALLIQLMEEADAPKEQFIRLGLK